MGAELGTTLGSRQHYEDTAQGTVRAQCDWARPKAHAPASSSPEASAARGTRVLARVGAGGVWVNE